MLPSRGRCTAADPRAQALESAAAGRCAIARPCDGPQAPGSDAPATVGTRHVDAGHDDGGRRVLVIFVDRAECWWLRALRPGFRHCFAVLRDGSAWLACDPLLDRIVLKALDLPAGEDLGRLFAEQGHVVLDGRTYARAASSGRPHLAPLTCVTVVKRVLGVRAFNVVTPWQLFRHLRGRLERPFALVEARGPTGEAA